MKASVIIPALNEEKLLPELLKELSVFRKKTNYDFEIILSDGGSKDKTVKIANSLVDKIFIYKEKKRRQTIAEGKNAGAKLADGDILIFICADCRFSDIDNFFNFVFNDFSNSDFDAATFKFLVFPEERKISDILFHTFYNNYVKIINILGLGMGRGECQVVKRNVFEKQKGFNETLAAGEDFDLFKRIKRNGKIRLSFSNIIFESPRRYRKIGYRKVFYLWLINALGVLKFPAKMVSLWEEVR